MRLLLLATLLLGSAGQVGSVQDWMQQAYYPVLILILVTASLGVPIPEDIPLITAGVLLRTRPGIASWEGTFIAALCGIMLGDLVLYTLGKHWGPGVVNHRFVRWMITPGRFERFSERFHRHGAWFCFFGRFFVGVRAAMCLTAGATRFPYWRFFLADLAGALLSVPFLVALGYLCAGMIPTLLTYLGDVQTALLAALVVAVAGVVVVYGARRRRHAAVGVTESVTREASKSEPIAPSAPATCARAERNAARVESKVGTDA